MLLLKQLLKKLKKITVLLIINHKPTAPQGAVGLTIGKSL
jgi:hypothetical protein